MTVMTALPSRPSLATYAALGAAIVAIFLVDLGTPLGVGVPFLYLLVALGAMGARAGNRSLVIIAGLCTLLAFAKLGLPATGVAEFGQRNRVIFALLMWTAVGLELIRRQVEARARAARQQFSRELERQVEERTAALQAEVAEREQAERTIHALAGQLVEAQEAERTLLAAELHDRIGQSLSALNLNLSLNLAQISTLLPGAEGEALRSRIRDSLALLEQTTETVRGVMEELHPALLDQYGLENALRWYGDEFAGRTGVRVVVEAPDRFPRLGAKVENTLFRIAQEALTNVAKHARARQATVTLARTPEGIRLTVTDDGIGMAATRPPERPPGSGWGQSIMAERARAAGGDFRVDSPPGGGTVILVNIANGAWENDNDHHRTDR